MPPDDAPPSKEPTAELTSRSAVVAAVLVLGAIIAMLAVTQCRQEGVDPAGDGAPATESTFATSGVIQRARIGPADDDQLAGHLTANWLPGDGSPSDGPA